MSPQLRLLFLELEFALIRKSPRNLSCEGLAFLFAFQIESFPVAADNGSFPGREAP